MTTVTRALIVLAVLLSCASPRATAGQMSASRPLGTSLFQGSVPTGVASATPLALTLRDAIDRGLSANLGAIEGAENIRSARADWLTSVSRLLPRVTGNVSATREQVAVAALGFSNIPGFQLPRVIGPFSFVDARIYASQSIFNWADIKNTQSAAAAREASEHSYRAARELVVQAAANAYLVAIADIALVDAARAQVETATVLRQKASDQNRQGVVAAIDVLRASVSLQTEQQRLIAAENQLALDKLMLARVIGLPRGQAFTLADDVPYNDLAAQPLDEALRRAYASRPDYQGARAHLRAAELTRQAASAEHYPSVSLDVNYGAIGTTFSNSDGTLAVGASVAIPIFQGLTVPAHVLRADAALRQARAELDDLAGHIDEQVRSAFLNLSSATQLVAASRSNVEFAKQTLNQAQDRLAAGVADNLEVVQAQESVAAANQSFIASVYSHNSAKVALAQAVGAAEQSALSYLGVK
jgi:outer membrane protein TolC